MNLQHADIGGYAIYWSWTLFFTAMALNGCILLQIAKQETAAAPTESQKHDQEAQLADKEPRIAG